MPKATVRWLSYTLIGAALTATVAINVFTLRQVPRAITSVPWWDQWAMVDELASWQQGQPLGSVLWASYWGHRLVIPRLVFFADARWASLASLTWLTLTIQFAHIGFLLLLAWLIFRGTSRLLFATACIVIFNLMLCPLQMQNLVWSNQVQYVLVYAAATAAFLLLAGGERHWAYDAGCVAAALIGTYSMANGLLVWPLLALQAMYLRRRRMAALVTAIGAGVIASYLWHYQAPMTMGVSGMLRDPLHSIALLGAVLGAPLDYVSVGLGATAAILATLAFGYLAVVALRARPVEARWLSVAVAIVLFLIATSASMVAGRLSPAWLAAVRESFNFPSRGFTPVCIFWTAISLLALYSSWHRRHRLLFLGFFVAVSGAVMFATFEAQFAVAEDWADVFRTVDAAGSALLLDVPDEELLAHLWPSKTQRDDRTAFLRSRSLALFSEPRAGWPGRRISELFTVTAGARCIGSLEAATRIGSETDPTWRMEGWAWDRQTNSSPADILFTDADGRIVGLARGGLRHAYFPGILPDHPITPMPAEHAQHRHSEWLGHLRHPSSVISVFGVLPDRRSACLVAKTGDSARNH